MKAKQIFWVLAVLMICSIFSTIQGTDKFYYGTYGGRPVEDFPSIKDSLKFNIVVGDVNEDTIDYYVEKSLRAIVSNRWDSNPPYSPSRWATQSHYTLWEAEGYPESYYGFTYTGGTVVSDPSASGGQARKFQPPGDQAGLIQTGPGYNQEFKRSLTDTIEYTAEFRLKALHTAIPRRGSGPPQPLCLLKVVGNGQLLAHKMVYTRDFENFTGYKIFKIENYTAGQNPIEFQIYWFGNRTLYIDYVKVYDDDGWELVDQGLHDQDIMDYVSQDWVHTILSNGDTVVYRWYLRDEPEYIDLFEPSRYIDSLLRKKSTERVGFDTLW